MKKILPLFALLFLSLAGCRGGGPGDEVRPTPISAPVAAEGGGGAEEGGGVGQPITLRLSTHQNEPFNAAYQSLIDAYTAANPGVMIVIESFDAATYTQAAQNALSAGTADIVQLPGEAVCGNIAHLAPVPEAVTTLAGAQAAYLPDALGGFVCDGALYGLPQESAVPWGLAVSNTGASPGVAWDFVRFAALDSANAAGWNASTGTPPALEE
jgi:ABC-type glycerol-3-phosphate transport system substrate-binding protein